MPEITTEEKVIQKAVKEALVDKAIVDLNEDKIKRAVKEALMDKAVADLGTQLTAVSNQIAKGFGEIHQKQDLTNGKVLAQGIDIIKLKDKGVYDKLIWLLITTLVGVVVYFISKAH